jgi:hypothetical protein
LTGVLTVMLAVLLQAAQPMPQPDLQPNVNLWSELAWAALNPAAIFVAYRLGRGADQTAKLGIAAFAAALAGIALLWLAARLHMGFAVDTARAAAGVFVMTLPFGVFWAWLGRRRTRG